MMVCCPSKRIERILSLFHDYLFERGVIIELLSWRVSSHLYISPGKLLIAEGDGLATVTIVQFRQHQLP